MASPPGTKISSASTNDGREDFTINYDETTRALVNRQPPAYMPNGTGNGCVFVMNTSSHPGVLSLVGAAVDLSTLPGGLSKDSITVPTGPTRLTAAQLGNVGFNVIEDVGEFRLGWLPGG